MRRLSRPIALLLALVQAFVAGGLGPRSHCQDPDGSACIDSVLTPCCCHEQRQEACCDDQARVTAAPPETARPGLADGCACICKPVAAQAVAVRSAGVRANFAHTIDLSAVVVAPAFSPPWTSATPVRCARVEPHRGATLRHLDTVILRL